MRKQKENFIQPSLITPELQDNKELNIENQDSHGQQLDTFICDILDTSFKDDIGSMEHPLFSLSTKPDAKVRRYERNGVFVEITPSSIGHATIFDKDILIYCISQLMEAQNRGREIGRTVRVTAFDLLTKTNRDVGGRAYFLLEQSLKRLLGTIVSTNVKTKAKRVRTGFSIIEKYEIIERFGSDSHVNSSIEITLSEWLFNAVQAKETLTLHPEYFHLRKALERRLYELARKHCGKQSEWKVSTQVLYEKSGSFAELKEFRRMLLGIVGSNNLPGYEISYFPKEDISLFKNTDQKALAFTALKTLVLSK